MRTLNILARTALTLFLGAACAFPAFSADCKKIASVDSGNANVSLRYVEQTDSTSLVYAIFTLPAEITEPVYVNVARKIYVTDGEMNYSLVRAHNVPVEDESVLEYAILENKDRKLNFILEFEKFPIDEKFDIVDESSETEGLNFRGVSVDASSSKSVDAKRFMSSTQLCRYGKFYDNGNCISYYDRDGVVVAANASYGDDNFTLYLSLVNNSDHGILFNTKNLTVKGHKPKGRDSVEVNLYVYSKNDYVDLVAAEDRYEAQKQVQSNGMREVESAVSFATIGTPIRSAERTGLTILSGVLKDINYNRVKPHLAELDKTREERTKDYLLSQSIDAGESHSGFLRISRPKKVNDCMVTLHVDGYDFSFDYDIK
ncbi:MAG: hypothetical protein MJY48_04640 [Bacteroidales bacterium]|nr:hypothetical protein [Bacteroidales bacterium]